MKQTKVFEGGLATREQLDRLGLSLDALVDVVKQGEYGRAEATDHDPVTAAGTDAYRYRVRGLRDSFCGKGWHKSYENGLELLVSDDGTRAVITRAGDENVGFRDAFPQPSRSVGGATENAVAGAQTALDPSWFNAQKKPARKRDVWMLLVKRSGDCVRSELSLALDIEGGLVTGWAERIILPEVDFAAPGVDVYEPSAATAPGTVDVPVIRKK